MTSALQLIAAEQAARPTPARPPESLAVAGACYVTGDPSRWPWPATEWKSTGERLADLVKGAGLIADAIDALLAEHTAAVASVACPTCGRYGSTACPTPDGQDHAERLQRERTISEPARRAARALAIMHRGGTDA